MTRNPDPLAAMRAANPVSATELRDSLSREDLTGAMRRAMACGGDPSSVPDPTRRLPLRRRGLALCAGLASVAAVAAFFALGGGSVGGGGGPAFAAAAIEVAEANPRLLVTRPGWKVTYAGEFEAGVGEVSFSDGPHRFDVHWYPARYYRGYLRDRAQVSKPETSRLLGHTATTVRYRIRGGAAEYATMLSPQGPVFVEVRGELSSHAEYEQILRSLRRVDVDTWLGAMPASVVRPEARAAVVERMLRGVPLPPGFDREKLVGEESVFDHYQQAVKVAGTVSCGWVESWLSATRSGDGKRAHEAVAAMATSHDWPMMPLLIKGGGWSGNVWHAAREIASGHLNRGEAGELVNPDGTGYRLGPAWAMELNCASRYWRRPLQR